MKDAGFNRGILRGSCWIVTWELVLTEPILLQPDQVAYFLINFIKRRICKNNQQQKTKTKHGEKQIIDNWTNYSK